MKRAFFARAGLMALLASTSFTSALTATAAGATEYTI